MAYLGPRPYVVEDWEPAGQIWVTGDAAKWLSLSGIGAFDTNAAAVGGAARWNALRYDRFAGGFEVELGYAWASLSVPLAVRLFDQTHVYSAPRVGNLGADVTWGVPVGLSVRVYEGFALRAEAQLSWAELLYYERRLHLGVAAAYQF